jgi:cell division septation protein DedD
MRGPQGSSADKWVVQIVALRDRSMAGSIVERLSGKGYPAFVVNPSAGTPAPVFKVQVGRYADREQAEQVARRLEKEEQFKPWVSR